MWSVTIISIVQDGDIFACRFEFIGQGFRFKSRLLVIDEVLQVVGIAALLGEAEQDHRLGNENAALRCLGGGVGVDLGVAVMQRLDLLS